MKYIVLFSVFLTFSIHAQFVSNSNTAPDDYYAQAENAAVFQDYAKAEELYKLAALDGNVEAYYKIALLYINGYGRDVDVDKAIEWYKKASKLGHSQSDYELGVVYNKYKKDSELALVWYKKAVSSGHIEAHHDLAVSYIGNKDYDSAFPLLKHATENGHAPAMFAIAQFYIFNILDKKDIEKGIQFMKDSAELKYSPAMLFLGKAYAGGQFVQQNLDISAEYLGRHFQLSGRNGMDLVWVLLKLEKIEEAKQILNVLAERGDEEALAAFKKIRKN